MRILAWLQWIWALPPDVYVLTTRIESPVVREILQKGNRPMFSLRPKDFGKPFIGSVGEGSFDLEDSGESRVVLSGSLSSTTTGTKVEFTCVERSWFLGQRWSRVVTAAMMAAFLGYFWHRDSQWDALVNAVALWPVLFLVTSLFSVWNRRLAVSRFTDLLSAKGRITLVKLGHPSAE